MLLISIFWNSEFATPQDSSVIFSVIVVISSLKHDVIPGYVLIMSYFRPFPADDM